MRGDEHKPGSPSLRRPRRRRPPGAAQRPAASPSPGTQPKLGPGATTKSDRAGGRGDLEKGGASAHSRLTPRGGGGVEEAERRRRASKAQASTRPADGGRDLEAGGGGDPRCWNLGGVRSGLTQNCRLQPAGEVARGRRDTGNDAGRNWDGFGLVAAAAGGDILPAAGSWIETVQLDE